MTISMTVNSAVAAAPVGLPSNAVRSDTAAPNPPRKAIVASASGAIAIAPAVISSARIIQRA